jgi:hypothetical protein
MSFFMGYTKRVGIVLCGSLRIFAFFAVNLTA